MFAAVALPAGSAVGSFVLRGVLASDDYSLCYLATASASDTEVTIEEYFPGAIAVRGADGSVAARTPADAALFAEGMRAFLDEAEQTSRLTHRALLRLGPVWQARGTAYRLRAPAAGRSLREAVTEMTAPPDEAWLRRLLEPLLGALQAVHNAGWVHGNVRPGNIVLQGDGTPLLLDSGAAGVVIGEGLGEPVSKTPEAGFSAPELLDGTLGWPIGPWSDLHSLAQVMRYCVTGEMPHPSSGPHLQLAGSRPALGPRPVVSRYASGLVATLERALDVDPYERPQSVAEFHDAMQLPTLRTVAREQPAAAAGAQPVRPAPPLQRPSSPPPLAAPPLAAPPRAATARAAVAGRRAAPPRQPASQEPAWGASTVPAYSGHGLQLDDDEPVLVPRSAMASLGLAVPQSVAAAPRRSHPLRWALGGLVAGMALMWGLATFGLQPVAAIRSAWFGDVSPAVAAEARDPRVAAPLAPSTRPADQTAAAPRGGSQELGSQPTAAGVAPQAAPPGVAHDPHAVVSASPAAAVGHARAPAPAAAPAGPAAKAADAAASSTVAKVQAGKTAAADKGKAEAAAGAAAKATASNDAQAAAPAAKETSADLPETPAAACAPRTNFALYHCMKQQCEQRRFYTHPQCIRLRVTDEVS